MSVPHSIVSRAPASDEHVLGRLVAVIATAVAGGVAFGAALRYAGLKSAGVNGMETIATHRPETLRPRNAAKLLDRVREAERRVFNPPGRPSDENVHSAASPFAASPLPASPLTASPLEARLDQQQVQMAELRSGLAAADRHIEGLRGKGEDLRSELRCWVEQTIAAQVAEAGARLQASLDAGHRQMLDSFAEGLQERVIQRISRLEDEVTQQSTALTELRDCSLQTERSLQKLLHGIERLVARGSFSQPAAPQPAVPTQLPESLTPATFQSGPAPVEESPQVEEPALSPPKPRRRWGIFG